MPGRSASYPRAPGPREKGLGVVRPATARIQAGAIATGGAHIIQGRAVQTGTTGAARTATTIQASKAKDNSE